MKEFEKEVVMLEKEVDEIREEVRLHEYCMVRDMNYHDSADYARAVCGLAREDRESAAADGLRNGPESEASLLMRNSIDGDGSSCYHEEDIEKKFSRIIKGLDEISSYGWFDKLGDKLENKWGSVVKKAANLADSWSEKKKQADEDKKKKTEWNWNTLAEKARDISRNLGNRTEDNGKAVWKASGARRNIKNLSSGRICVTGTTNSGGKLIYLRPGAQSSPDLYDADGVVILPGQKFYATLGDMISGKNVYSDGVIKVYDAAFGWGTAEVYNAKGKSDTFYVNSIVTKHLTMAEAKKEEWKLP